MRPVFAWLLLAAAPASATGISTHVLDLAKGIGGAGIPVVLEARSGSDWREAGRAVTEGNGRVKAFGNDDFPAGDYRLRFDMTGYSGAQVFFPEISVTFRVAPGTPHVHVPVAVSPFGYSTYRGN